MFASRRWTELQVGSEVVASLVLWKVGFSRRVPSGEADVSDALGGQYLLTVIVLWLGDKDVIEGLCPLLGLFDNFGHSEMY